jgi:asparagine synthase (glutamine-hydrolysing)
MCGFAAFLSREPIGPAGETEAWMTSIIDTIAHRGPDDFGVLVDSRAALGFRRLSILDVSEAGHQPMTSADGRYSMVFNGEIYNYVELRNELQALGHRIRSSGDSEVLLAAYIQWGEGMVDRLVGMFAFCIVDRVRQQMFVGRDRFGIKPLFVLRSPRGILFASELKAIRRSGLAEMKPNVARFARFLSKGRTEMVAEDEHTFLDGVQQLQAGETLTVGFDGKERSRIYWNPYDLADSGDASASQFNELFDEAIRMHLRSDVPVGVMLSGGMDSVSITCRLVALAHNGHCQPGQVHAFCYQSADHDESVQVADTVRSTGVTPHYSYDDSARAFWNALPAVVWHHDEPFHSPTVLVGYELYRLAAANGIKVVLSGQGADEVLGGYPDYYENMLLSLFNDARLIDLRTQLKRVAADRGMSERNLMLRVGRMARNNTLRNVGWFRDMVNKRRIANEPVGHLNSTMRDELAREQQRPWDLELGDVLRGSIRHWSLPQYLRVDDRNSMAHSVEARVPFLDHRLVEYALRLPSQERLWNGWNKVALRNAMRGRIPDSVVERRAKLGFPTAARRWLAGELLPSLRELILDGPVASSGWLEMPVMERLLREHGEGRHDHTDVLFAAAQTSVWLDLHGRNWERPACAR